MLGVRTNSYFDSRNSGDDFIAYFDISNFMFSLVKANFIGL